MAITPLGPIDYYNPTPPDAYCCGTCGAKGVKLWRWYQTFLETQDLFCAACAEKKEGKPSKKYGRGIGDQIGWLVPAVPTEDGTTYWGYTSVPENGCQWWYDLPVIREKPDSPIDRMIVAVYDAITAYDQLSPPDRPAKPIIFPRTIIDELRSALTDVEDEALAVPSEETSENERLRRALAYTLVFREFSDEWHNMGNSDVVEFRRLRDAALNPAPAEPGKAS